VIILAKPAIECGIIVEKSYQSLPSKDSARSEHARIRTLSGPRNEASDDIAIPGTNPDFALKGFELFGIAYKHST